MSQSNKIAVFYPDDLLIFAKSEKNINDLKSKVHNYLRKKYLRRPATFLGVSQFWKRDTVYFRKERLIKRLMQDNGITKLKPVHTLLNCNSPLISHNEDLLGK